MSTARFAGRGAARSARVLGLVATVLGVASLADAQTFTNATPLTIPDFGPASLYPSPITVSGVASPIQHIAVTINGLSHTWPGDLIMLLVAPSGVAIPLTNRCGGSADAINAVISFDDSAPTPLYAMEPGTYPATACSPDIAPAPAPPGPYESDLMALHGLNANGTWKLYVVDMLSTDSGSISAGWSITFGTMNSNPSSSAFTYQGVLTDNGSPHEGPVAAKFHLYDAEVGGSRLGPPLTRTVDVNNGLFTTWLDYGDFAISASSSRWLEVILDGQVQSPRQRLMNAPTATRAKIADTATHVQWSGIFGVPSSVSNAFSPWTASGANIAYAAGAVAVGTPTFTSKFNVASTEGNTSYQTSASQYGTYAIMHNDTAGNYWQLIATGTGNSGGANDLIIANSVVPGTASSNAVRITSGNYMGIALPVGTLPSQRLTVNGNVLANNVAVPSSIRFKDHVVPMDDALARLLRLEGVRFDWKPEWAKDRPGREHDIGFVAEDVAKEFPEVVFYDADGNVTGMDYSRMTAVAIEAIKQQQAKFDAELAKRDAENAELRARLERLERALAN